MRDFQQVEFKTNDTRRRYFIFETLVVAHVMRTFTSNAAV